MNTKYKVCVKQEDIDGGIKRSPQYCPIALAVKRQFPEETDVFVGSGSMTIGSIGRLSQSKAARRFIRRFDRALPVEPFCFMATRESI